MILQVVVSFYESSGAMELNLHPISPKPCGGVHKREVLEKAAESAARHATTISAAASSE